MNHLATTNPAFVEAIKSVENNIALAKKSGEYKNVDGVWLWFPGRSPEGGLPTLAWGHKLTQAEWSSKRITFEDGTSKDFRYGLNDESVNYILIKDLNKAEDIASNDWDRYLGVENKKPWESLPDKYKGVLINLCFNAGSLVKKGKWVWSTVAKGILANDDVMVTKGMVTSYKKPDGTRVQLTTRAETIAKALGLPWQAITQKYI